MPRVEAALVAAEITPRGGKEREAALALQAMGFRVHDPKLYEGLDIGDTVSFTLSGVPPNVEITAIAKQP